MAKHPQAHLRTRILIWSFVPTTIILFAVAVTIYITYQNVTEGSCRRPEPAIDPSFSRGIGNKP